MDSHPSAVSESSVVSDNEQKDLSTDPVYREEQAYLSEVYAKLERMRDEIGEELETGHAGAAQDLKDLSEEIRIDFGGADETMETLAAIETLNSVIDAYNQYHDFTTDKLRRVLLLLQRPYFAKVRLRMRPGRPPRDIYIGAVGITDEKRHPLIVDWRSPVAETYYNQEMGDTSYEVDGRTRHVTLELRRQFEITRDHLDMYFDTTVAIQDSLLLESLRRHHTEKLQAITATIQREQNEVIRHKDIDVLIVNGVAGSGKTSVMLQRIAYLLYRERETLSPDQVFLFTPNDVFESYIDTVLPSLGEANPQVRTWRSFLTELGLSERGTGADDNPQILLALDQGLKDLVLEPDDFHEIAVDGRVLLKTSQVVSAAEKFERFGVCPRFSSLVKDDLHERLERRLTSLSKDADLQEEVLSLNIDEQIEAFGETINPLDEDETIRWTRAYLTPQFERAHELVERGDWLRVDRIGMRILGTRGLSAAAWLYLKIAITGNSAKNVRYVLIDEVQDYTETQLLVLARYFSQAHFMLLGDEFQAIREGTASFPQIRNVFASDGKREVEEVELLTSYRSSPEITDLFASLLPQDKQVRLTSVHPSGIAPVISEFVDGSVSDEGRDRYLSALRNEVANASAQEGLTAIITLDRGRMGWLAKQLGDTVRVMHRDDTLPADGVVLLDLALAKGLEFDGVIIPDAQADVYPDEPLARRRLYTAISRAMHRVTILSQGKMTPLLSL